MAYLVQHHGTLWFQIRVPRPLAARYGRLVRQNLQTTDRAVAQMLAFQLAGQWLARFTTDKLASSEGISVCAAHPAAMPLPAGLDDIPVALPSSAHQVPPTNVAVAPDTRGRDLRYEHRGQNVADSLDGILKYWRQLNPAVRESTYKEIHASVRAFKRVVRKRPVELQRSDIAAYRDKLIGSGLARATVGKKVGFISTLLQTAFDAGFLPQNPARGMRIPKPKVPEQSRRAFTADELKRIFTSPIFTQKLRPRAAGGEAAVWVPLIALATGARLEEICQLRVADLSIDPEHGPLMRISDSEAGQSVKTVSSRRTVPLHPDLVRAGLMRYWDSMRDAESEWLFPELEPDHDGRRGGNYGKWFARYLRSTKGCGIVDKRVVFHSFRHTFKTLCRDAGIAEEVHDALTGHVGRTVGRSYGHMPLSALTQAVARIRYSAVLPGTG